MEFRKWHDTTDFYPRQLVADLMWTCGLFCRHVTGKSPTCYGLATGKGWYGFWPYNCQCLLISISQAPPWTKIPVEGQTKLKVLTKNFFKQSKTPNFPQLVLKCILRQYTQCTLHTLQLDKPALASSSLETYIYQSPPTLCHILTPW